MLRFPFQPDKGKTTFPVKARPTSPALTSSGQNSTCGIYPSLLRYLLFCILFFITTASSFTGHAARAQTRLSEEKTTRLQNHHSELPDTLDAVALPDTLNITALRDTLSAVLRDTLPTALEETQPLPRQVPLKQHLLGIRGGYAFNTVHFNPDRKQKNVPSWINASLLYTYYHHLWGNLPYFGVQTGFTYTQQAYDTPELKRTYEVLRVPLTSQFHIDMWKTRLLVNLGCFAGYRMSATDYTEEQPQGIPVTFDCNHIYADYGFQGGLGFALVLKPFEFQIEANYLYSLSMIENPALYSNEYYTYGYPGQLLITFGIFIHLHK